MRTQALDSFGGYVRAMELFQLVVADMKSIQGDPLTYKLVSQQVGSADSIAANIEEGYGRLGTGEFIRFLDFARSSARETRGRYIRMMPWFSKEMIEDRAALCDEIIGILTSTIATLRAKNSVREEGAEYVASPLATRHSTLATRHSPLDTRHSPLI
ncbi:MAG: four helix bundle protein [bacterium]